MAVAGLAGCAANSGTDAEKMTATAAKNTADMMHCYSANVCKGHNDCKTATNSCAGHASCKGTGFVSMPAKACADVGGEKKDDVISQASTADFIHCHGANVCKGHNDCATANNACAGQGSCKGLGFVAIPAKSCADIGGTVKG